MDYYEDQMELRQEIAQLRQQEMAEWEKRRRDPEYDAQMTERERMAKEREQWKADYDEYCRQHPDSTGR